MGYELYIFDVDGTLADRDTNELLPGVAEWFVDNERPCAFATNQGGVGLRYWMETGNFGSPDEMGLPTEDDVWDRLHELNRVLGNGDILALASFVYQSKTTLKWSPVPERYDDFLPLTWRKDWRKPCGGMIAYAKEYFHISQSVVMVGDSPEDEQAAKDAGVDFLHADVFFGRN